MFMFRIHDSTRRMLEFATHFKQVVSAVHLQDLEWDLEQLLESAVGEIMNCKEEEEEDDDDNNGESEIADRVENSSFKCIEAFNAKRRDADKRLIDSIETALDSIALEDRDVDADDTKSIKPNTKQKTLIEEISSTPS